MSIETGPGSNEGYASRERSRDVQRVENMVSPEVRSEAIELIATLLAKLVEIGPAADPHVRAAWRAQLQAALASLGIDIKKDYWGFLYGEMVYQVFNDRQFPKKPAGYPEFADFQAEVQKSVAATPRLWGDLRGRDGKALAQYLYGLGFVLASELSYGYIFPESDPIVVSAKGEIEGRHRYLTLAILEELGFDTSRWSWVHVEFQRSK